jgi:hypothetical protein
MVSNNIAIRVAHLFCFVFVFVCTMLLMPLNCPFKISPWDFSEVYYVVFCVVLSCVFNFYFVFVLCLVPNVPHISGLSIHDYPFDFLYRLWNSQYHGKCCFSLHDICCQEWLIDISNISAISWRILSRLFICISLLSCCFINHLKMGGEH